MLPPAPVTSTTFPAHDLPSLLHIHANPFALQQILNPRPPQIPPRHFPIHQFRQRWQCPHRHADLSASRQNFAHLRPRRARNANQNFIRIVLNCQPRQLARPSHHRHAQNRPPPLFRIVIQNRHSPRRARWVLRQILQQRDPRLSRAHHHHAFAVLAPSRLLRLQNPRSKMQSSPQQSRKRCVHHEDRRGDFQRRKKPRNCNEPEQRTGTDRFHDRNEVRHARVPQ